MLIDVAKMLKNTRYNKNFPRQRPTLSVLFTKQARVTERV
jgi:hypothetical protein